MNRTGAIRTDAIALAVCGSLTALVYLVAVRPTLGSQARASETYQHYQTRSQQSDELARKAAQLEISASDLRKRIEQSAVKLRKVTEVNAILDELANLARSHNVKIDQVSSGDPVQGSVLAMAPIKLTAAGAFPDVVTFLVELERTRPEISTIKFSLDAIRDDDRASPENAQNPASRTRLTMSLEWYAEPAGAPASPSSKDAGTAPR